MMKMSKHFIIMAIYFCIITSVFGLTDKVWLGNTSSNWLTEGNWNNSVIPSTNDLVKIGFSTNNASIIGYDKWGKAGEVWVGSEPNITSTLIIDNFAGLDVNSFKGDLYIGKTGAGYVYIRDGFIWCRNCYVNTGIWGQLEINSGGLTCNTINVAGRVNLYGFAAYIDTNDLQFSGTNKAIELKDGGRIVWYGNHQTEVENYISQSLIYCEGGTVLYDYNFSTLNATTVYATTKTVSNPISLSNQSNQTISGKYIRNFNGHGISLTNCTNITIQDCEIGPCKERGIITDGGSNITITDCKFRNCVAGVWFWDGGSNMKVLNSWFLNMMVRAPYIYAHGVAMCDCTGSGLEIKNNRIQNQGSFASMTDNINTYLSNGNASSPLMIENNWIKNWNQMEYGGCGITTGDQGGSYNEVRYNRIVNPQYGGISIAGGQYANIHDNFIFGDKNRWNLNGGAGIVVWDYEATGTCNNHTVINNHINFWGSYNGVWFKQCKWQASGAGSCGVITGWNQNDCGYTGTPDDFLPGNIFYKCTIPPTTDLDDDCTVTAGDVEVLSNEWLLTGEADFNGDNIVNMLDYAELAAEWLECGVTPATSCP